MQALSNIAAFKPENEHRTRSVAFLLYILVICATHGGIETGVRMWGAALATIAMLVPELTRRYVFWLLLLLGLSLNLVWNYADAANHYYVTLYVTGFFAVEQYRHARGSEPAINLPRGLLLIVFGFATLQKLWTPYFTSGRLLGDYFLRGSSLQRTLSLCFPGHGQAVFGYLDVHAELAGTPPVAYHALPIAAPDESFLLLCQVLVITIAVVEGIVFLYVLLDKLFNHATFPLFMLAFVWGTFFFRDEYAFFSLICLLVYLARPTLAAAWKLAILVSFCGLLACEAGWLELPF